MPVVILMSKVGNIPAIVQEKTDQLLLDRLATFSEATGNVTSIADARLWLRSMPAPSGWYDSHGEMIAAIEQFKASPRFTGKEVRAARRAIGFALGLEKPLSRVRFAEMLGYNGNERNNGDIIGAIELGKKVMGREKSDALNALLLDHGINSIT